MLLHKSGIALTIMIKVTLEQIDGEIHVFVFCISYKTYISKIKKKTPIYHTVKSMRWRPMCSGPRRSQVRDLVLAFPNWMTQKLIQLLERTFSVKSDAFTTHFRFKYNFLKQLFEIIISLSFLYKNI